MLHKFLIIILMTLTYSLAIVPSVVFTKKAEQSLDKEKRQKFIFFSILAILLPCLLAAFRGITVGNDVLVYADPVYRLSLQLNSFGDLLSAGTRYEPGYLFIAYLSAHVFHSFHCLLFLTQLFINLPIYVAVIKFRNFVPAWSSLLCFYLFFYIETFNIMRQGIAVAFVFLAFSELIEGNKRKAIIATLIGELFHSTAVIGIALIIFIIGLGKIESKRTRIGLIALISVGVPLLMKVWVPVLTTLSSLGIIKARYVYYATSMFSTAYFTEIGFVNYLEVLSRWCGTIIPLLFVGKKNNILYLLPNLHITSVYKDKLNMKYMLFIGTFIATMIYTTVFVILHSSYGYRVSFYLEILYILWMPLMMKTKSKFSLENIPFQNLIMIASSLLCFMLLYMWRGVHGTKPFFFQLYNY